MANSNDPQRDSVSILGPTLRFKGELHSDEDLMIRGHVEGSITHTQRLTICRDGIVKADIQGQVIAVEGRVEGDLSASTSVAITETGTLKGDVCAPSVSIVDGASVNGSVTMNSTGKPARSHRQSDGRPAGPAEPARVNGTGR
ncbi:MAG: polymer-forming cytoskeletal protein [Gammaproteobacteria bacterium]